jgi:hypothetical protein
MRQYRGGPVHFDARTTSRKNFTLPHKFKNLRVNNASNVHENLIIMTLTVVVGSSGSGVLLVWFPSVAIAVHIAAAILGS